MGLIPNVVQLYPDELLYSWMCRLAKANCLSLYSFARAYMGGNFKSDGDVPYDLRQGFNAFYNNLNLNIDMAELFMKTTTFSYESIVMSNELQTKYITNAFYKSDAINTSMNHRFKKINICLECVKEDIELFGNPYFHRTHQLRGVHTCHKHGTKLLKYIGKPGHAQEFVIDNYKEVGNYKVNLTTEELNFAYNLLNANIYTNIQIIRKYLKAQEKLFVSKEDLNNKYALNTTDIVKDLYIISKGNIETLKELISLNDNSNKFNSKEYEFISGKNNILKTFRHHKCGNIFCTTTHGFKLGWGCPYCIDLVPYQKRIEIMIDKLGNGEYKVLSQFESMNQSIKIKHKNCGNAYFVPPREFINEGVRCICKQIILYKDVKEIVEKSGKYKLIQYTKTEEPIIIQALECGHIFKYKYRRFINTPYCRICRPKNMSTERFQNKIKEITNDEYEAVDEFVDYIHQMTFKHKKCGSMFKRTPKYLLQNPHCPICDIGDSRWGFAYKLLCEYRLEFGNTNISKRDIYKGFSLGNWCFRQRQKKKKHNLPRNKAKLLREIGFIFDPLENEWNRRYKQYKRYIKETGTCYIPRRFIYEEEKLGAWVDTQKKRYRVEKLSIKRMDKLLELDKNFFKSH
ncbi:Helicase associated domain protein [uncultured Fusobacterium sp.]|uniref:Helicase associated domain protein n=1 Tax=uncultured Fusobacterium sp. TaxID=159267 RepID=UPI0028061450|nr:Helicase associated domain protein [uncultured Fusobacterium sp.]